MAINLDQIKELRESTHAGVMDCRKALEQAGGDFAKAVEYLREKGLATAAKRAARQASEGVVELYSHGNGRVGVMVEVNCETDFVARSEGFRSFAHELALQIAASAPQYIKTEDVTEEMLAHERENAHKQAAEEGKTGAIAERIVEESIQRFLDEACLLRQVYIRDESLTVEKLLMEKIAAIGENIVIRRFTRWELGESTSDDIEG